MTAFVIDLLINAIVALVAAVFAVRISLHKFSTQKWWERREETYTKIIGILSVIRVYLGDWENDELNIQELNQQEKRALYQRMREESEKIELVAAEGAFRISEKSNDALMVLVKSLNQHKNHQIDTIKNHYNAIDKCLNIVKSEATKDLRIKKKWYQI